MYESSQTIQFDRLLHDGIMAAKSDQRRLAQSLLNQAILLNPADARPYLWLSSTTDDPAEKRQYLEQAIAIEPGNAAVRRGLALLTGKLTEAIPEGSGVAPRRPAEPEPAQAAEIFLCPQCGARLAFDIHKVNLACPNCGTEVESPEHSAMYQGGRPLDFVLPTARGHRWAEAQHHLCCERCGAMSLWPVGQQAGACPYCGSNQLIESTESAGLVDPQAIVLIQLDEHKTAGRFREWLGRGLLVPDDLAKLALRARLRPGYYPFWIFDGTLEARWSCEVNIGTSRYPVWETRNGMEYELFHDILTPGTHLLPEKELNAVGDYNFKEMVEFKPEYLAGWPALTYDQPMAEASLAAREKVMRQFRRGLSSRVEPGRQKRNLQSGAGNWSDMTFKYVLLPLWVGSYSYLGKSYNILVNGQTGKVSADKPLDRLKVAMFSIGGTLILLVLSALAYMLWAAAH